MDAQTIALLSGAGVVSVTLITQLGVMLRRSSKASPEGRTKDLQIKLQKAAEQNDNPFENVDSFVIRLGDGFGRIYVVKNELTGQHFLFSKDFSIAEWQK